MRFDRGMLFRGVSVAASLRELPFWGHAEEAVPPAVVAVVALRWPSD